MDGRIEELEEEVFGIIKDFARENRISEQLLIPYMAKGLQELADIEAYKMKLEQE